MREKLTRREREREKTNAKTERERERHFLFLSLHSSLLTVSSVTPCHNLYAMILFLSFSLPSLSLSLSLVLFHIFNGCCLDFYNFQATWFTHFSSTCCSWIILSLFLPLFLSLSLSLWAKERRKIGRKRLMEKSNKKETFSHTFTCPDLCTPSFHFPVTNLSIRRSIREKEEEK